MVRALSGSGPGRICRYGPASGQWEVRSKETSVDLVLLCG